MTSPLTASKFTASNTPYVLGLLQMQCSPEPAKSLAHALDMLSDAAKRGVQVAVLPELFLTDYFCQREDAALFDLAEPIPGPTTEALSKAAKQHGMVIVGSVFERRTAGIYHNTSMVFERDGQMLGLYRKMHIPHDPLFYEKYYFTPGDLGFKTFPTSRTNIGTLICWDQWYPEGARLTALAGAELLVYPTAIGWHPKEKAEFGEAQVSAWQTMQRAHAIANGVFVGAVNRIGHEVGASGAKDSGIEFWGHSFIADPFGRVLAQGSYEREEIVMAECNPALIEDTRRNWPFLRDRRIDAYAGITQRFGS